MVTSGELPQIGFIRGNTWARTYAMYGKDDQDANVPFSLDGITDIRMDVRDKPTEDGTLYARLRIGSGITKLTGDDSHKFTLNIDRETSLAFVPNASPFQGSVVIQGTRTSATFNGKYYADIAFFVGDEVKTWLKATVYVIANITSLTDETA